MTREEQIKEAAKQYCEKFPRGKTASFVSFRAGVEWNEQNQSSIDWQQIRIQAAIAAMQGLLSNEKQVHIKVSEAAYMSVLYADSLVKELKEK